MIVYAKPNRRRPQVAPLYVSEVFVNATEGYRYSESEPQEAFTDDPGELYRALVREYGRCTGKVFTMVDGRDGQHIGWVFERRVQYEDSSDTYLRETWVTLHDAPDTITRTRHVHIIGRAS